MQGFDLTSDEYEQHLLREKTHFNKDMYRPNLSEKTSQALEYILDYFKNIRIKKQTGLTKAEHILELVEKKGKSKSQIKILSLGSGPGGWEISLSSRFQIKFQMDCIDINEKLLALGQKKAKSLGLNLTFIQQDINKLELSKDEYDLVLAHASLHHMINHEHIVQEVKKSLKFDGNFIVHEPIPRNGLLMWEETKRVANDLWSIIPAKYKYDCVDRKHKEKFLTHLPEIDHSESGFECIRSQDLYPILKENFHITTQVYGFSFARRFFDARFGCNYDISNPIDKAIIDLVIKLDEEYTITHKLKPEQIFLIMDKK